MSNSKTINIRGELMDLNQPRVMGVCNITPDSFYSKSRFRDIDVILLKCKDMLHEGADFIDIGGYSSRPGAKDISVKEELSRVIEPISKIREAFPEAVISIDTFRTKVAEKALAAGADLINDISGGHLDSNMLQFVGEAGVPYIAMHMKGTPQNMIDMAQYENLTQEIIYYFSEIIEKSVKYGIHDLIVDPGFGFSKNVLHNFELLDQLQLLQVLERPMLVGLSRKSMIYKTLKISPDEALSGTSALNALALYKGVDILRVHDVKPAAEVVKLLAKMKSLP